MVTAVAPAIPYIWDDQANIQSANVAGVINKANAVLDRVPAIAPRAGNAARTSGGRTTISSSGSPTGKSWESEKGRLIGV